MLSTKHKATYRSIDSYNEFINLHLKELTTNKVSKHPLYNKILKLLRDAEIPYTTSGNRVIYCEGLLSGVMFRPEDNYCRVFVRLKPYSFNLYVQYDLQILLCKLLEKKIISRGKFDCLIEYAQLSAA